MKLSKNLPQFEKTPTLIITAGWQDGKVYYAFQGKIVLNKKIKVPYRKYSDREGYFEKRSDIPSLPPKGGAVYEKKKHHIRDEFLNKLAKHIKNLVNDYKIKEIYIFSSPEGIKSLKKEFPAEARRLIKKIYKGNYAHSKPDNLVELIRKKQPPPVEMMKEEAKKILDRTKRMFGK